VKEQPHIPNDFSPLPIEQETGWDPQHFLYVLEKKKISSRPGNENQITQPTACLFTALTTLSWLKLHDPYLTLDQTAGVRHLCVFLLTTISRTKDWKAFIQLPLTSNIQDITALPDTETYWDLHFPLIKDLTLYVLLRGLSVKKKIPMYI
jgi:hypothetical protein